MLKLRKIINQLEEEDVRQITADLEANKAQNFLFLFNAYKAESHTDQEIIDELGTNANAFYVLKSRLHEKIQHHLAGSKEIDKEQILRQISNINQYNFDTPRETAVAILLKLEKDLKQYDLPADLTAVYSMLKKLHLNSPKYFHYSQLYNKHIAYAMVLEKAEDILGNFTRTLSACYFSRSEEQKELLRYIKKEIDNIYALNNAHRIEFIKNLITIQSLLFCHVEFHEEKDIEDLLTSSQAIIAKYPNDSYYRYYSRVIEFLAFEYYEGIGQMKKAIPYFDNLNDDLPRWLLYSNCCQAYRFLISRIKLYSRTGQLEKLYPENQQMEFMYDKEDQHTETVLQLYLATSAFYAGRAKEGITILNDSLNSLNTKESIHMEMEIKSTLAYFYYTIKEFDMTSNLLRSMYRKVNSLKDEQYENVLDYTKLMNLLMNSGENSSDPKKLSKALKMFEFSNAGETKILEHLASEFERLKARS